jgi:prevent-host-death family protein
MSKTISLDELLRKAERLLRAAWEEHESVVLARDGEPVAAVVPMDDFRRLHPETVKAKGKRQKAKDNRQKAEKAAEPPAPPLAYELPPDVLTAYHRLVSKKFAEGLTPEEEAELARLDAELDAADAASPLERAAREAHERRTSAQQGRTSQRLREPLSVLYRLQSHQK